MDDRGEWKMAKKSRFRCPLQIFYAKIADKFGSPIAVELMTGKSPSGRRRALDNYRKLARLYPQF